MAIVGFYNTLSMLLLSLLLTLFVGVLPGHCSASPNNVRQSFQETRSSYLALKQKDPGVQDLAQWETLAWRFREILIEASKTKEAPRAAFLAADLLENVYRARQFRSALNRSFYYYAFLADRYQDHYLADDALYRLGQNSMEFANDETKALAYYEQIIVTYLDGDMYELAASHVQEISANVSKSEGESKVEILDKNSNVDSDVSSSNEKDPEKKQEKALPKQKVVVIDPGHGGEEEGAIGVDGYLEKDIVLRISIMLEELLKERLDVKVVLTRRTDVNIPFAERTKIANDSHADLFISIHANASVTKKAMGVETYYLDNTNDASSLRLAKRENAAGNAPLDDLSFIISDLIQYGKLDDSISLSHYLQESMVKKLSTKYDDIKDIGVKKAPFYVLVGAHMACSLVEVSFIDHPIEGRRLIQPQYQRMVAEGLYEGIKKYLDSK